VVGRLAVSSVQTIENIFGLLGRNHRLVHVNFMKIGEKNLQKVKRVLE
jgi:hypothetical protein